MNENKTEQCGNCGSLKSCPKSCSKKKSTRGQIETMGLLVIVILVSLILFFVLSFNINKARNAEPAKDEFNELQAVSNFGTTILETTNTACARTMRELLTDCAYAKQISCGTKNSCDAAGETIETILDSTFNLWGYEYNLTVENEQGRGLISFATGCNVTGVNSKKEITPFGTKYGSMALVIKTC